ncbi:MAG: hypothetical protein Q8920_16930 [Bacillota bacterium]|nr:hypothetical protein [Bacillota bacterium]
MPFCDQCGNQVNAADKFCEACGAPVVLPANPEQFQSQVEPNNQQAPVYNQQPPAFTQQPPSYGYIPNGPSQRRKMGKKSKIAIIIAAVLIVLGVAGYFTGSSVFSKSKVISNFNKALSERNVKELSKYIVSSDPRIKVDEKNIKSLIDYLNEDPSYLNVIMSSINEQSKLMDSKAEDVFNSGSDSLFKLKKKGKTFLVFNKYVFEVEPFFINVHTNYKNAQIYLDDKLVCTAAKDDFTKKVGPYIPGIYKIKVQYKGEYATLEDTKQINSLSGLGNSVMDLDLNLDGRNITIDSTFDDAKVFLNGKDTGLTVQQANENGIGPVDSNVTVMLQKDFPWGAVKSDEVKVEDQTDVSVELNPVNDTLKNQMMDNINQFNLSDVAAVAARDATKYVNMTPSFYTALASNIQDMKNSKRMFKGKYTKIIYDLDSIAIDTNSSNQYTAEIVVHDFFNDTYYDEGDTNVAASDNDLIWRYSLVYDQTNKKWLVDGLSREYSIGSQNTKEFDF